MSLVPLPWCTSQSRISTRSRPRTRSAWRGRDGHVVEQAEPHRPRRQRMVPRRPVAAEHRVGAAVEQQVDQLDGATGGVQRRLVRARAGDRVGVEVAPSLGRNPLDRLDVRLGMHRGQVGVIDRRGLHSLEPQPVAPRTARARSRRSEPPARDASRCRARANSDAPGTADVIASTVLPGGARRITTQPGARRGGRGRRRRAVHGAVRGP